MQERKHSHQLDDQRQNDLINQIQIDEQWICKCQGSKQLFDLDLLTCPICCGIPLNGAVECDGCGRIFCQNDFKAISQGHDTCPLCKKSPFKMKKNLHILYKNIYQNIRFECRLCFPLEDEVKEQKNQIINKQMNKLNLNEEKMKQVKKVYRKNELFHHINDTHKAKIMDFSVLYDFQVHFKTNPFQQKDQPFKIIFDFYQNMELNHRCHQISQKKPPSTQPIFYQLDDGTHLMINFQSEIVMVGQKKGKLIKKPSKQLQKDQDYAVWQIQLDYGYKYYSQEYQKLIETHYQEYLNNNKLNEFLFDLKEQRYRVSFRKMKQINTYTEYERPIKRSIVRFK